LALRNELFVKIEQTWPELKHLNNFNIIAIMASERLVQIIVHSKTCNFTICSIFSNSGHVGWCTASPDTILKLDTLVMILTKFGFHWSSTFRGEDFSKSLQRTTTMDAK
jgi:hypothetical protein